MKIDDAFLINQRDSTSYQPFLVLAGAVINQALKDATGRTRTSLDKHIQNDAISFLTTCRIVEFLRPYEDTGRNLMFSFRKSLERGCLLRVYN